jgi:nucleotide-binding universal stress UspA family protein
VPGHNGAAPRIVVGVDGSPASLDALRWAVAQAELTGASVQAVQAWQYPAVVTGYAWAPVAMIEAADLQEAGQKAVKAAVRSVVDPASDVPVTTLVRAGHAAHVLLDVSDGADLLVVGSRGHGGFSGALLGSVSQHCVQHARCPVVVIRGS